MLRKKELKLVVTFYTTGDAMAMEAACKDRGYEGRLIPVPRTLSAGCGLAWKAELDHREKLAQMMEEENIDAEGLYDIEV